MDSRTRLDYALFQLTPTRTRCDLVIFAGNAHEKLASGLLEPFLSHLKFAEDQISRGGYSVTLRPPADNDASWFTKATLQRFVKFVNSPEVLERFGMIEREIAQIKNSIQKGAGATETRRRRNVLASKECANKSGYYYSSNLKTELDGTSDTLGEENSKVHLQHILETRMTMLQKEQAMVCARALVAGFETSYLHDLFCFADAFGSPRLREACLHFMELCNKKSKDGFWMDEVAALQAHSHSELSYMETSGMIHARENYNNGRELINFQKQNARIDAPVSHSSTIHGNVDPNKGNCLPISTHSQSSAIKVQAPSPWASHLPRCTRNRQGLVCQQIPPYQGYIFPGMQPPPYYQGDMPLCANMKDRSRGHDPTADDPQNTKSFSRSKEKPSRHKGPRTFQQNDNSDSDSSSGSYSDVRGENGKSCSSENQHRKKHGKSPSGKLVIRNINYLTPKRDEEKEIVSKGKSSDEDGIIDGCCLEQHREKAVGSIERRHKSARRSNKRLDESKDVNYLARLKGSANQESDIASNSEGGKGNGHWDILQNLIARNVEERSNSISLKPVNIQERFTTNKSAEATPFAFAMESKKVKHPSASTDSLIVMERDFSNEIRSPIDNFEDGENAGLIRNNITYEEGLFSGRIKKSEISSKGNLSEYASISSIIRSKKEADWFMENFPDKAIGDENISKNIFDGGYSTACVAGHQSEKSNKDLLVDDYFAVQNRVVDDLSESQIQTDMFIVSDIVQATRFTPDKLQEKVVTADAQESVDLFMVLERGPVCERGAATWISQLDSGSNDKNKETVKRHSDVHPSYRVGTKVPSDDMEKEGTDGAPEGKVSSAGARSKTSVSSLGNNRFATIPRSSISYGTRTTVQKSKSEKEEEERKKMEKLLIQRQKRIAERGTSNAPTAVKMPSKDGKTTTAFTKSGKTTGHAASEDSKEYKKLIFRSSTIARLAAARPNHNESLNTPRPAQPRKETTKENGVLGISISQLTSGSEKRITSLKTVKPSGNKNEPKTFNGLKNDSTDLGTALPIDLSIQTIQPFDYNDHPKNVEELRNGSSVENNKMVVSQRENLRSFSIDFSIPGNSQFAQSDHKGDTKVISKASSTRQVEIVASDGSHGFILNGAQHSIPMTARKSLDSIREDNVAKEEFAISPKISVVQISTPPPDCMSPGQSRSRKKWHTGEKSPKSARSFRKLLLFGQRS